MTTPIVQVINVPVELVHLSQWVNWRYEKTRDGERTKVPHTPSGSKASTTDSKTWSTFEQVTAAAAKYDGIGIVCANKVAGVDLDDCIDEAGNLNDFARHVVEVMNTYAEITPSGGGIRCLCWGKLPPGGRKSAGPPKREMYDSGRFFTVTGNHLASTPFTLEERTPQLAQLHAELFPIAKPKLRAAQQPALTADTDLLQIAFRAANGAAIKALWDGNLSAHNRDHSAADQALCNHLAFYTAGDAGRIDRLFRQSALMRDKWDEKRGALSYGERTIAKSLEGITEFYDPARRNGHGPHAETPPAEWHPARPYTDEGNAERLVEAHGAELRYCYTWAKWLVWDGRHWIADDNGEVKRRAMRTVRAMLGEAEHVDDKTVRAALVKHERQSEGTGKLNAMLEAAEKLLPITARELDRDPWLLNCMNGTLALHTGALGPHRREDYITKLAPVHFDPGATLPAWDQFLRTTTRGNQELQSFLQRAAGYSLTGDTSEEVLFFVHGPQAAGKSTFVEAFKASLGEYGSTTDFETFLSRRDAGGVRNDIAKLAGARFVASIEVDEGKRLAEGLVKTITGGDTVSARFLYSEYFEFVPAFKLWLCANHAPRVNADDGAMWRRILRVPFEHVVPKAERDPKLKATLKDTSIAGPAILAWAVAGCRAWQDIGLSVPAIVTQATEDLRLEMDILNDFIGEACMVGPQAQTPVGAFRSAFDKWAKGHGELEHVAPRAFNERMTAKGFTQDRTKTARIWRGIGLISRDEGPSE